VPVSLRRERKSRAKRGAQPRMGGASGSANRIGDRRADSLTFFVGALSLHLARMRRARSVRRQDQRTSIGAAMRSVGRLASPRSRIGEPTVRTTARGSRRNESEGRCAASAVEPGGCRPASKRTGAGRVETDGRPSASNRAIRVEPGDPRRTGDPRRIRRGVSPRRAGRSASNRRSASNQARCLSASERLVSVSIRVEPESDGRRTRDGRPRRARRSASNRARCLSASGRLACPRWRIGEGKVHTAAHGSHRSEPDTRRRHPSASNGAGVDPRRTAIRVERTCQHPTASSAGAAAAGGVAGQRCPEAGLAGQRARFRGAPPCPEEARRPGTVSVAGRRR